jgi:hypothetical protein
MKAAGLWLMMEDFPFCAAAPIVPISLFATNGLMGGCDLSRRCPFDRNQRSWL